jgi:hypothetical protein
VKVADDTMGQLLNAVDPNLNALEKTGGREPAARVRWPPSRASCRSLPAGVGFALRYVSTCQAVGRLRREDVSEPFTEQPRTAPTQINVVLNWSEELKRLVPAR